METYIFQLYSRKHSLLKKSEDIDMKRTAFVLLCLMALALLVSGCQSQPQESLYAEATQHIGPVTTTAAPTTVPTTADADATVPVEPDATYTESNALGEEGISPEDTTAPYDYDAGYQAQTSLFSSTNESPAIATSYPYTGSTPIPLNPIDAPTPTPQAPLNFTYVPYSPASVGVTFEAPAGWIADDSYNEVFTLSEPESQMKNGQLGIINVYAVPVGSDYSESELTSEIKQRINTIGSLNFSEWKPSLTDTRYLMGKMGVYANYTGTLLSGVEVGGRVHATTIDSVLYCIQITYPLSYKDDFMDVFRQLRDTIERY